MKRSSVVIVLLFVVFVGFSQSSGSDLARTVDPSAIDIVRDRWGVPHIFAKTDAEVAYGLAWAHSEDDFETIQKTFIASKAMLGQLTGREGATVDYIVQLLRIRELVDSLYEKDVTPSYKLVVQGYCDGLNAYGQTHPKEILIKKAFPVTPKDVIGYSILQLAMGCGMESALKKIFHGTIPLATGPVTGGLDTLAEGSNGFAFNSKKTKDGNVYLAINTHHPLESQVSWYEAHLSSEEGWNILGALFPGSPVIFTGINEHLGWTHTVNYPDRLDVYQLELDPENRLRYKVDNKWYHLEETIVKLKVKMPGFNVHVKKKAYWSIYGPTVMTEHGAFSIRTAGIMDIRGLEQWYKMNKSRNFGEFKKALKMHSIPSYNIIYGDRYDTIFYLSNGKIPYRNKSYNWLGTLPGNTSRTLWTKFHPLEELPQVLNPASGYLYNTNHSPFNATASADNIKAENFDPTMGYETNNNNRSLRMMELMEQYPGNDDCGKISFEDFKRIKYDLQLPKKLAFPVNIDTLFLLNEKEHPQLADVITVLKNWDRKGNIESKGATVFAVLFYYVAAKYQNNENLKVISKSMSVEAMQYAKEYLIKNFGTTRVQFGEYQRLERGERSMPLPGLPDVLAAMYSSPTKNGRVKGTLGECYIALAKFTHSNVEIETVNCFGASNRKGSLHYDDQMELFQSQQTKKMTLNKEQVYREGKTVYHPEILSKLQLNAKLTRGRR